MNKKLKKTFFFSLFVFLELLLLSNFSHSHIKFLKSPPALLFFSGKNDLLKMYLIKFCTEFFIRYSNKTNYSNAHVSWRHHIPMPSKLSLKSRGS